MTLASASTARRMLVVLAFGVSTACSTDKSSSAAGASPSPPLSDTAAATPDTAASAGAAAVEATASVPPAPQATPNDIAGVEGEKAIAGFAKLGVVDPASGAFRPSAPVMRRDFIRWLVKANNALWADTPGKQVHLADASEASAFVDVTPSDRDFPYLQGMQDAGYSVGFPDKHFRPDVALTREQLFAIKNVFDRGSVDAGLVKDTNFARNTALPPWKDKVQIAKAYVGPIASCAGGGAENFQLVYGASSLFHPALPVTRAQAAVAISVIGDHVFYGSGRRSLDALLAAATP